MAVWLKSVLAVAVMVVPGAFVLFLTFVAGRALYSRWARAQLSDAPFRARDVVGALNPRELLSEARRAFQVA